jgi:hypothetical protein
MVAALMCIQIKHLAGIFKIQHEINGVACGVYVWIFFNTICIESVTIHFFDSPKSFSL